MESSSSFKRLINESRAFERSGNISAAFQSAQVALVLAQNTNDPGSIAQALVEIGKVRFRMGEYDLAGQCAQQALALALSDWCTQARAWQVLANCAAETESFDEAENYYHRAVSLARESGDQEALIAGLHGLAAGVHVPCGRFELAMAAEEEILRVASSMEIKESIAYPFITMAMICQTTWQINRAYDYLDQAYSCIDQDTNLHGYCLCIEAFLALDEGNYGQAYQSYKATRGIADAGGEPWLNISFRLGMSHYYRLLGEGVKSRMWAEDAFQFAKRVGYRHEQAKAWIAMGRAAWLCHDHVEAMDLFAKARNLLDNLGAVYDLAYCQLLISGLLWAQNSEGAQAAFELALKRISTGGYAFLLARERHIAYPIVADYLNSSDKALAAGCALLLKTFQSVPALPLQIQALGCFSVSRARQQILTSDLHKRHSGELLMLLLLSPSFRLSAEQAIEALFPGKDSPAGKIALHQATSHLRRLLEPELPDRFHSRYLEFEGGWIQFLLPPGSSLDWVQFSECCQHGAWGAALDLYQGEFLPDLLFADWTIVPRQRYSLLFQRAMLGSAEENYQAGAFQAALDDCLRLIEVEPWHEKAVLLGMQSAVELSDYAAARHLFLELEKRLLQDLHTYPQGELRSYYQAITPDQ